MPKCYDIIGYGQDNLNLRQWRRGSDTRVLITPTAVIITRHGGVQHGKPRAVSRQLQVLIGDLVCKHLWHCTFMQVALGGSYPLRVMNTLKTKAASSWYQQMGYIPYDIPYAIPFLDLLFHSSICYSICCFTFHMLFH